MQPIEQEYKATRMSLRAHLGSSLATVAVFAAIASTGIQMGKLGWQPPEERAIHYLAPPQDFADARSTPNEAPISIDTFAVDLLQDHNIEELELIPVEHYFNSDISPEFSLNLQRERRFQAAAPELNELDVFTIFERSEVDEIPILRYSRPPTVPRELNGEKVEVIVFYYVDDRGRTDKHSVLDSSSANPIFGERAVEAIESWRFRPARKNGKNVPCWVQQTIKFNRGSTSPFTL